MRGSDLKAFKNLLLKQKAALLNKAFDYKIDCQTDSNGDEADVAASELQVNITMRIQERERTLVHKIDRALEKIENGSYGSCEDCGEALGVNRLKARPIADLCIACKEDQEDRERMYA